MTFRDLAALLRPYSYEADAARINPQFIFMSFIIAPQTRPLRLLRDLAVQLLQPFELEHTMADVTDLILNSHDAKEVTQSRAHLEARVIKIGQTSGGIDLRIKSLVLNSGTKADGTITVTRGNS